MSDNNAPRNPRNQQPKRPQQRSQSYNTQQHPQRPQQPAQRRPQNSPQRRPQQHTPRAVVFIYVIMAVLILGICIIVLAVMLNKDDTNSSDSAGSSVTSNLPSDSSDNSQSSTSDIGTSSPDNTTSGNTSTEPISSDNTPTEPTSSSTPAQSSGQSSESEPPLVSNGLTVLGANMVYVGEGYSFSYEATGYDEDSLNVKWICAGDSGTITEKGLFTALKKGTVTLTATDTARNISGKILVHVINSAEDVDFVPMVNNTPVVNKTYPLPSDYAPGGLTAETDAAFKKLVDGAAADGINIFLVSGYRSYTKQQNTYLGWCNTYGQKEADRISARPGFSEHQLGMAIDVNSLEESFADTAEGKWLAANCWEYGFIIRYPKGKEHLTGYAYEPWHIRYVGKDLAKKVTDSGLCLEEYFGIDSVYR